MRWIHKKIEVINIYKPDVVALVETWLKGEEEIAVEGYRWLGKNGRSLHWKGSGGVELLVCEGVGGMCS